MYNKWAPKRQPFSYAGMIARSQLAITDFNEWSNLEHATKAKSVTTSILKITKNWSAKPVKKEKDIGYLFA